ncbi:MAG: polyprenyl synthetase family protein, partial [Rickettsia endosymbiont of Ixodes persulcatus]|nr:polyprenyl synthetase family protein [Rickettsia endosymbiont of Ixodes persulcatus]
YNIEGGKNVRMSVFIELLSHLGKTPTESDIFLGACIEIMQTLFLISDDIADRSKIRRGKPCWYKVVGVRAIKDTFFLYSLIFKIINKYCGNRHEYQKVKYLFQKGLYITCIGQSQDTLKKDFGSFDMFKKIYNQNFYRQIVYAKTAFYTVYLPFSLAYIVNHSVEPKNLKRLSFEIGYYMQFQDDYLNFFPEQSGKSGTDLDEKKVTWYTCRLVSEASTNDNINEIMEFFVNGNTSGIYKKIQAMLQNYEEEEEKFVQRLKVASDESTDLPFKLIMKIIYKRKK